MDLQAFPTSVQQTETPARSGVSKVAQDPSFALGIDHGETRSLRALHVLDVLSQHSSGLTLAYLSELLHIPKASLMRLLQVMEQEGYVQRELDRQTFTPGPALASLSLRSLQHNALSQRYRPALSQLVQRLGETCNLTVLAEQTVLYLDRVETSHPLRMTLPPGARVPLHCTASGKLFLAEMERPARDVLIAGLQLTRMTEQTLCDPLTLKAELDRAKSRGFGVDNEEFISGMVAVAVPVRDKAGRCVAAVACHAPTARYGMNELIGCVGTLKLAAVRIADILQHAESP